MNTLLISLIFFFHFTMNMGDLIFTLHTLFNVTALCVVNALNLFSISRLNDVYSFEWTSHLCDTMLVVYQCIEMCIDIMAPQVTSSLRSALVHHLLTAFATMTVRSLVPYDDRIAHLIKHEIILCGELQNLPRMVLRLLKRETRAYSFVRLVSDFLLVTRFLIWPLLPVQYYTMVYNNNTASHFQLVASVPLVFIHFVIYSQQFVLFRRDIARLRANKHI